MPSSRRQFLTRTALGLAGIAAGGRAAARAPDAHAAVASGVPASAA
jgi:hypothetical protein